MDFQKVKEDITLKAQNPSAEYRMSDAWVIWRKDGLSQLILEGNKEAEEVGTQLFKDLLGIQEAPNWDHYRKKYNNVA